MQPIRYSDINLPGARDFVIRRRAPTIPQMLLIFLSVLLISISVTVSAVDRTAVISILMILLGAVGWYVIVQLQKSRDLVLATEFQNLLFASALGINNKFCLIIRRDGNIVYLDRSFQDLFPDFLKIPQRTIDMLLAYGKVAPNDRNKVFAAIDRGIYDKVIIDIRGSDGQFHKIVMTIEPIMRPSGFILLRGREYIEQRASGATDSLSTGSVLNKSTITLFSHVMDTLEMGVYMTGPSGNIVYANALLEQWLGFREGEITSSSLSLQDIFYQSSAQSENIEPENYEGEATFLHKTGTPLKAFINQKVMRNEQNKILGCTAVVHTLPDQAPDVKKKPW